MSKANMVLSLSMKKFAIHVQLQVSSYRYFLTVNYVSLQIL